jgi:hypothetical protein
VSEYSVAKGTIGIDVAKDIDRRIAALDAARYAFVEQSILVVTEGLGQQRFHGRVVVLVVT